MAHFVGISHGNPFNIPAPKGSLVNAWVDRNGQVRGGRTVRELDLEVESALGIVRPSDGMLEVVVLVDALVDVGLEPGHVFWRNPVKVAVEMHLEGEMGEAVRVMASVGGEVPAKDAVAALAADGVDLLALHVH